MIHTGICVWRYWVARCCPTPVNKDKNPINPIEICPESKQWTSVVITGGGSTPHSFPQPRLAALMSSRAAQKNAPGNDMQYEAQHTPAKRERVSNVLEFKISLQHWKSSTVPEWDTHTMQTLELHHIDFFKSSMLRLTWWYFPVEYDYYYHYPQGLFASNHVFMSHLKRIA